MCTRAVQGQVLEQGQVNGGVEMAGWAVQQNPYLSCIAERSAVPDPDPTGSKPPGSTDSKLSGASHVLAPYGRHSAFMSKHSSKRLPDSVPICSRLPFLDWSALFCSVLDCSPGSRTATVHPPCLAPAGVSPRLAAPPLQALSQGRKGGLCSGRASCQRRHGFDCVLPPAAGHHIVQPACRWDHIVKHCWDRRAVLRRCQALPCPSHPYAAAANLSLSQPWLGGPTTAMAWRAEQQQTYS